MKPTALAQLEAAVCDMTTYMEGKRADPDPLPQSAFEATCLARTTRDALFNRLFNDDGSPNRLTLHRLRYNTVEYTPEQAAAVAAAFALDAENLQRATGEVYN